MLNFGRLSNDEYVDIGNSDVWSCWDVNILLTSFELEASGIFHNSKELYFFNKYKRFNRDFSDDIEGIFKKTLLKWNFFLRMAIIGNEFEHTKVPGYVDLSFDFFSDEDGENGEDSFFVFRKAEFLRYIESKVKYESFNFDCDKFIIYLSGFGSAPTKISGYLSDIAHKRHDPYQEIREALEVFLMKDLSGGCTCTKVQACERIFLEKFRNNKTYLKNETGYGYLMFTRKVSEALQEIERKEKSGINRHENTDGFIFKKVPPCMKHAKK